MSCLQWSQCSNFVCCAGVIHRDMGNLEHAAQCYLAALQIRPNFPQVSMTTYRQLVASLS